MIRFVNLYCCAVLFVFSASGANAQEGRDEPDVNFAGAQDPPDEDSLQTSDIPFPFFSQFVFGAGSGTMPLAAYETATTNQSLYLLNLGIEVPFFIDVNFAFSAGMRVAIQYPTYLNIKDGEPTFHLAMAPTFEAYRNIVSSKTWDIDLIGGLNWNFRRSQYAVGTLASNGPELKLGSKFRWLPYMILDSTPVVNISGQFFGPLNSYSMRTGTKDSTQIESEEVFSANGSLSGYTLEMSAGISAPSSVAQTENEFLLGYITKSIRYAALRNFDKSDVSSRFGAFFIAWRRTWVK